MDVDAIKQWVQMAFWGVTILGILVGYRPPKRHTRLDNLTIMQKVGRLDLPGMALVGSYAMSSPSELITFVLTAIGRSHSPLDWTQSGRQSLDMVERSSSDHTHHRHSDSGHLWPLRMEGHEGWHLAS